MGQLNDIKLTTWADGYGNWHVRTEHTADREFAATCRREALAAIREEIGAREGKSYDPSTVGIKLRSEETRGGMVVREYVEVVT